VDDPRLINVAVSRAIQRFVLVTNHDTMPSSRHVRDLVGHIRYLRPEEGLVDSTVVSIFDLLYRDFSRHLRSLDKRLKNRTKHRSENIAWTVLLDLLGDPERAHLTATAQVLVDHLVPDRAKLTKRQAEFVGHRASVDFVVYNRVTNRPLLAIEVDGFKYHEDDPKQLERDAVKDEILRNHDLPLLRLPTTGSGEQQRIRRALDAAEGVH
jgi:very-short-patch-repair endonuclease